MLNQPRGFWSLFGTDMIVRTGYQMGKTPALPMFAAAIGAGELMIGTIVAVSTMNGMLAKPLVGALSDRWGRRLWFFAALILFSGTPFLYQLVETRSEEHTSEIQSLMRISYAVFCLTKKKKHQHTT